MHLIIRTQRHSKKHMQIQYFDRPDLPSLLPRLATNPSRWLVYMYHFKFRITVYSDVVLITAYNGQLVVIKFNDIRWSIFFAVYMWVIDDDFISPPFVPTEVANQYNRVLTAIQSEIHLYDYALLLILLLMIRNKHLIYSRHYLLWTPALNIVLSYKSG